VPLIRSQNVNSDRVDLGDVVFIDSDTDDEMKNSRVLKNDVLLNITGASIGRSAVYKQLCAANVNQHVCIVRPVEGYSADFIQQNLASSRGQKLIDSSQAGGAREGLNFQQVSQISFQFPLFAEQVTVASAIAHLDHLITLHQRESPPTMNRRNTMFHHPKESELFSDYYGRWIRVYKEGAIRNVTLQKYRMTQAWIEKLVPHLKVCDMSRTAYQQLLNAYAECHERQTTMDFHHQLKGAILDAVDEGLVDRDPTRKAIIKGMTPRPKKPKFLNQFELHTLLSGMVLTPVVSWDWFILLVAKTGMRFSEALALTPLDFDFSHQSLSISKTWDYKGSGGFLPTKNRSSVRKIQIDWQTVIQFSELVKCLPDDQPLFINGPVFNSTVNDILRRHCVRAEIPTITIHGLRHTHASLLLFAGVSIASVARRLGHSSMTTTQKTYVHIIQELENQDIDLVMRSLSSLS